MENDRKKTRQNRQDLDRKLDKRAKERARRRRLRKKRQRRRRLIATFALGLGLIFAIRAFATNTKRDVKNIANAIRENNMTYLKDKTDSLDKIIKTLGESYSKDEKEASEFLENNFKNLTVDYLKEEKVDGGREISLDVSNINYIDVYDSLKDKSHQAYIKKLGDENTPKKKSTVKIFVKSSLFKNKIYESRPFVNAILGKALDYVKD